MRTELFIAMFAIQTAVFAQAAQSVTAAPEKHSATSTLEFRVLDGKEHTIVRNQSFSVIYRCLDECANVVLRESFYSDQEEGVEGAKQIVTVAAWRKDTPTKQMWTLKAPGGAGKALEDFYEVTWFGCCGDWDEKSYFSLRTGRKIYSSSTDNEEPLVKIEVPNTKTRRYLSFRYVGTNHPAGQLQYGDAGKVLQTVTVRGPSVDRPPTLKLRIAGKPDSTSASLWPHNGETSGNAVSGVSVVLTYDSGEQPVEVVIPIENDRLVVQKAKLPSGYGCKN